MDTKENKQARLEIARALGVGVEFVSSKPFDKTQSGLGDGFNINFINKKEVLSIDKFDLNILEKYSLCFENCVFECEIKSPSENSSKNRPDYKALVFFGCTFKNYLQISNCSFEALEFKKSCQFEDIKVDTTKKNASKETKFLRVRAKSFIVLGFGSKSQGICQQKMEISSCFFDEFKIIKYKFEEAFSLTSMKNSQSVIKIENTFFENEVSLNRLETKNISCKKNTFKEKVRICLDCCEEACFVDCKFNKKTQFIYSKFGGKDSKNICDFNSCIFKDNVYFNNSKFNSFADFHECEFEKTACFYGVSFDRVPNFSQVIFKGNLNAVNTNLNFDFNELKARIESEYKEFNKTLKDEDKKPLAHFANDFRDSFRVFKDASIKQNDILEAQKYHRLELYCKEIELKECEMKKAFKRLNNFVDYHLLGFYRRLSEHHTSLLRVFNNAVILVALYALCYLGATNMKSNLLKEFLGSYYECLMIGVNVILSLSFVILYIVLIYLQRAFLRAIIVCAAYVCALIALGEASILNPFISKMISDEALKSPLLACITLVYSILSVLLIFSLQKTARKNSIIPS